MSACGFPALFHRQRSTADIVNTSEGKVRYRLILLHDLTYAVELTMADRTEKLVRGFVDEAAAVAWIAEQRRLAPKGEAWIRRPKLSWR